MFRETNDAVSFLNPATILKIHIVDGLLSSVACHLSSKIPGLYQDRAIVGPVHVPEGPSGGARMVHSLWSSITSQNGGGLE